MTPRALASVVLAAGEGKRMRSARPKPLHLLCGRAMLLHILDAVAEMGADRAVVVVGHGAERITKKLVDDGPPAPGTALLAGDRSVGNLVNAVRFDDGHCELLAVIRHDASGESLVIEGMPEARLSLLPLPYAVPEREKSAQPDT